MGCADEPSVTVNDGDFVYYISGYKRESKVARVVEYNGEEENCIIPDTFEYEGETYTVTSFGMMSLPMLRTRDYF